MMITTTEVYDAKTWHGKTLRLFDTNTGIEYRFSLMGGELEYVDAVRLSIESAHANVSENQYSIEYTNGVAIQFMRQMCDLAEDKSLIDHWCEEAIRYLDEYKYKAEEERCKRERETAGEFEDLQF